MPPRPLTALIIVAWAATMGWFLYREWRPHFQDSTEPPFTIELADEATPQTASWRIYQGDKQIGRAASRMAFKADDTFELQNSMSNVATEIAFQTQQIPIQVKHFSTTQHVTRQGQLISVSSKLALEVSSLKLTTDVSAVVKDDKLYPTIGLLEVTLFGERIAQFKQKALAPVDLPARSMWNPMEPFSRIRVRPGQRWRLAALSPLENAIESSLKQLLPSLPNGGNAQAGPESIGDFKPPKLLDAEVLREPRELAVGDKKFLCHVIEYHEAEDITHKIVARTWIQAADFKVIRQEAIQMTGALVLQRED